MHYNYFSGRIYVEETPEQYCLGYHNSQKAKKDVWWNKHLLREEIDASEWNVGKPNRDSTMGAWDDTHKLLVWWQAYPSKKKQ